MRKTHDKVVQSKGTKVVQRKAKRINYSSRNLEQSPLSFLHDTVLHPHHEHGSKHEDRASQVCPVSGDVEHSDLETEAGETTTRFLRWLYLENVGRHHAQGEKHFPANGAHKRAHKS